MSVALYFLFVIFLMLCSYFVYNYCKYYITKRKLAWLPAVPGWPIIGCALEFGDNSQTLHDCDRLIKRYGELIYFEFLLKPQIMSTDYDFVEYILSTQDVLSKSTDYKFLHNWLGTGLLTSDGPKWKKRRKMVTPAFHFSILEKFIEVFEQNLDILISELNNETNKDAVDIYPFVNLYALDVICEAAMGVSVNAQKDKKSRYVNNVKEMCRISIERVFSVIKKNDVLYLLYPDYYKEQKIVKELHSVTNSVIDSRKKELASNRAQYNDEADDIGQKKKMAFLDILLRSTIDGEPLSREDIREEVDTFMFAGHDTVTSAASFSLYLLAMHPDVQKRAVEEQKRIFENDINRKSTYYDLQEMKYLEMIIKESLRLYPPAPVFARETTQEVKYKGKTIPKDVNIIILTYSILRDPRNFENPEKFDPDRFQNSDGTRPYTYIPFSAGPRNCIGQKFAMLELKSTLSRILRSFELFPPTCGHKMVLVSEAVLKSINGTKIKLSKRRW
nr:cytochrome P450 [Pharsalia antennata]